ncbi:MAG: PAS domain S-box protein [Alphaproteobacteria bacterium]|nr:PAS domain S-box protein [Alphaproteobacteria bacterium]
MSAAIAFPPPALAAGVSGVGAGEFWDSWPALALGLILGTGLASAVFLSRRSRGHGTVLEGGDGEHFRQIAEFAGDWVWEMDRDFRFTYISDRFFELYALTPDAILGKTRGEFKGAGTDNPDWKAHLKVLESRKPFRDFTYPMIDPNGKPRHIRVSGRPLFGTDGVFRGYQGTGTDLTAEIEATRQAARAEATLLDAVESIDAGLALFDADDRLVLYNSRYRDAHPALKTLAIAGTRFEDIVRGFMAAGLYDASMGSGEELVKARMELHRNTPSNHEQRMADGRWVDVHEYATHDGGRVLLLTDITERKKTEQAIQESEARLRAVLDHSPASIALKDSDGRYLLYNKVFAEWMNISGDEMIGRTLSDVYPVEDFKKVRARDQEVMTRRQGIEREVQRTFPDGKTRTTMVYKFPVFGPGVGNTESISGVGSVNVDISRRKEAEQALEESEARFRNLIEGSVQGVLIHADNKPLFINQAYADIFGYDSPEEMIALGDALTHVAAHERDRMKSYSAARVQGKDAPVTYGFEGVRKDGTRLWLENRARGIIWKGQPAVQRTLVDITERHQADENLRRAKEEADIANRAKSEFLANMSHELRTPLNSVIGFSEILKNRLLGPPENPKYQEYAADIHFSGRHLLSLISDILDVSKIEVGELDVAEDPLRPDDMIAACVRMIAERAERANVDLLVETANGCPSLLADERRLKQVLLNLLSNSVKFTPPGGKIVIGAGQTDDGGLRFWVSDTGIGISAEDIPKVLKPFSQVAHSSTRSHEGTGLGLTLSKSLSELQGGRLDIESEPDQGTTVSITFPVGKVLSGNGSENPGSTLQVPPLQGL